MSGGSYHLKAWISQKLDIEKPGYRFPTDKQLGAEFGITERTVRTVFKPFRERGKIVRLAGRGTFIPVSKVSPRAMSAPKDSAQRLADHFYHAIIQGFFQRGSPLPQIKYTNRQFRVGPSTVIAAYRRLETMGLVTRIGKAYWVGNPGEILRKKQVKQVYVFNYESGDYSAVFNDNYFASAYVKFEKEMALNGHAIIFESTANLFRLAASWRKSRQFPRGLVFVNINPRRYTVIRPLLEDIVRHASDMGHDMPVLLDWIDYTAAQPPAGMDILRREHVVTSTAMELVAHMRETGCHSAHLFLSLAKPVLVYEPIDCIMLYFKLLKEVKLYDPGFRLRCTLVVDGKKQAAGRILRSLPDRLLKAEVYAGIAAEAMRRDIAFSSSIGPCISAITDSSVCIFSHDTHAIAARAHARNYSLRIPEKLSLISLENDPAHLHAGISYCGPDWERIGYAMAHAIVRDILLDKSTMGYLRTWAFMLHRQTTHA